MDLKVPKFEKPKLPKITVTRKQALTAAGTAVFVVLIALVGGMLLLDYTGDRQVATFGSHVAASEADLSLVSGKVSSLMRSSSDDLSVAECDAYMREFAAVADYGMRVTAYHRQIVGADRVPEAYAGAQSAYIRALDNLNRAFSLWSSAAAAYDAEAYTAAKENLARADQAWKEYTAAIEDYDRELRIAEEGGWAPPA
ncbi:hypothetical protein [Methanoculleus sp.]|jgi:tetratricopeptide (TPR) repeat protein|uniref:hypothetical protein n=1 Tax=Methanoculleus sp. TaxID=90427 RepID=UPI001BD272ED|nr:hypothetical protein [Methanoculleus sp.]